MFWGFKVPQPGVPRIDFTNILRVAFTFADHKSAKKTDSLTVFFLTFEIF